MESREKVPTRWNNTLPAYLQAGAAILSLAVAWYVGYSQNSTAQAVVRAERELQGKSLLAGIRFDLIDLRHEYDQVSYVWLNNRNSAERLNVSFTIPDLLLGDRDKLYLLGDRAGPATQQALADARRLAMLLQNARVDVHRIQDGTYVYPGASWSHPNNEHDAQDTIAWFNETRIKDALAKLSKSLTLAQTALDIPDDDLL